MSARKIVRPGIFLFRKFPVRASVCSGKCLLGEMCESKNGENCSCSGIFLFRKFVCLLGEMSARGNVPKSILRITFPVNLTGENKITNSFAFDKIFFFF